MMVLIFTEMAVVIQTAL